MQHPQRILVVEPDEQILDLLERWLGEAGFAVTVDASRQSATADLVIIDVPEPLDSGGIIESVRRKHATPILLISARFRQGMASSSSVAQQLGVCKVLPKPFTRDELLSAVGESLASAGRGASI